MNVNNKKEKNLVQAVLMIVLLVLVIGNFLSGIQGFLSKGVGKMDDDFIMRYRESKYIASGINPFDIINGVREETSIGSLWDVAGYTPWGMVYGILLNFTFLPEKYARYVFCALYLLIMFASAYAVYMFMCRQYSKQLSFLIALVALGIPGWGTGLSWLNFGALFGVAIFFAVMIVDKHPLLSGILFGLAATKPQLALPFYLGLLIKKKYRTLLMASVLPACAWIVSCVLTSTLPFKMLIQYSDVMKTIGGQLGNWISSFSVYYDVDFMDWRIQFFGMFACVLFAMFLWHCMEKNNVNDKFSFFSVAAVLSGMWTYAQAHDRTVLLVVIIALAFRLGEGQNRKNGLIAVCYLSFVVDTARAARMWSYLVAPGVAPSIVFDGMKYLVWACCLLFLAQCNTHVEKEA